MVNLPKSMTGGDKEKQYDRKMLEEKYQKPLGGIKYTQAGLHFLNEKKIVFFTALGINSGASHMLDKCSTSQLHL